MKRPESKMMTRNYPIFSLEFTFIVLRVKNDDVLFCYFCKFEFLEKNKNVNFLGINPILKNSKIVIFSLKIFFKIHKFIFL